MPIPGVNTTGPTLLSLGLWNTLTDQFVAHPACPTGAILNLNDGTVYSILDDDQGLGQGFDMGMPAPTIYKSRNPRTTGARVTRRIYDDNRRVAIRLFVGPSASWAAFQTALHNIVQTLEGVSPDQPAALAFRPVQSSTTLYLDVLAAWVRSAYKESLWNQLVDEGVLIELECRPFLRGPRQTLQNLASNPGFEQPFGGGTAQTAPLAFNDPITTLNAYTVQAGGALAQDTTFYPDVVQADAPLHYYRLDEPSGATSFDAGTLSNSGSYLNSPTLGAASLLTGDADAAVTFAAASSQRMTISTTGLPTGNSPISVDGLLKITANPASTQTFFAYGNQTTTNHQNLHIGVNSTGKIVVDVGGAAVITSGTALTTGVAHYVCVTWDGTTLALYQDALAAQTATPGAQNISGTVVSSLAAAEGGANFFSGTLDEWAIYGTALAAARVAAHQTAATTTPAAAFANSLKIPAAGRVSFGSPAWGALQTWQVRFRYLTGLTASFYLHYTDASNSLRFDVASGANGIKLVHRVSGVDNVLAQATAGLAGLNNATHYWAKITQFPTVSGNPPYLICEVHLDLAGTLSANLVASLSVAAFDAVTALVGQPQMAASGAALGIGGGFSQQQAVALFGPGGWFEADSGTGTSSGAWDGAVRGDPAATTANTFPNGPVTSFGAARIDCAPAGTINASWTNYNGGTPAGSNAIPVSAAGNVLGVSAYVHSTGLGVAATQKLSVREYDASGNLLRTDTGWTAPSLTGNQAWPAAGAAANLSGSYTTGASCAYLGVSVVVADTNAGASANGIVWCDNVSVWNQTTTGMTSMAYHELRFPNSPAQLMVSGIVGDVPAPAFLALGTFRSSFAPNTQLTYTLGRRGTSTANWLAVYQSLNTFSGQPAVLDSTAYGGLYTSSGVGLPGFAVAFFTTANGVSQKVTDAAGTYDLQVRGWTAETTANLTAGDVATNFDIQQRRVSDNALLWQSITPNNTSPFATTSTWTVVDFGLFNLPATVLAPLADASKTQVQILPNFQDFFNAVSWRANAGVLIPADADLLRGTFNNGSGAQTTYSNAYPWLYADGTWGSAKISSLTYSVETTPLANPSLGLGGPGPLAAQSLNINGVVNPYVFLDPSLRVGTTTVNQFAGYIADGSATVQPLYAEIQYSPLYNLSI